MTGETMNEGSDLPPMPEAEEMPGNDTVRLPLAALATPDEKEQMVNPSVGDKVTYQVEAEVVDVQADMAIVRQISANGEPLAPEAAEPEGEPDMASLESEAQQMGPLG